jgi:hypothetical protein
LEEFQLRLRLHFQNIFAKYPLIDNVIVAREVCKKVIPSKVWSTERDFLGAEIMEEDLQDLNKMKDGEAPGLDGLLCELF